MSDARYLRQTILPEIGLAGQAKLADAHVLVVGAGGLGSPILQYLAAAGVGRLTIIDGDRVELSNLQRQVLFTTDDLGHWKAERAAEKLLRLNSELKVRAINERLTSTNAMRVFEGCNAVVDGTDNFSAKFLINDAAVKTGTPLIYGSILRFEGQVSVFNYQKGPCYRCLYPEPPKGVVMNCAEAGVLGAIVGVVGSMQALEALKVLVGLPAPEQVIGGALLTVDGLTLSTRRFKISKRADCAVCSRPSEQIQLSVLDANVEEMRLPIPEITQDEALNFLGTANFIDVREPKEWESGTIPGATLWPLSRMQKGELPEVKGTTILYCQSGARSQRAAALIKNKDNLFSLQSGFGAWRRLGV